MQDCTSLQTDNHASIPSLSILQTGCPSCHPINSVKARTVGNKKHNKIENQKSTTQRTFRKQEM